MKLFIHNLNFKTTSEGLAAIFRPYGEVISANVVNDKETGRSKGFGFVEMADIDAAEAIKALDKQEINGRAIGVREAQDKVRA